MKLTLPFFIAALSILALLYLIWWDIQHPSISFIWAFFIGQIPSAIAVVLVAWRCFKFTSYNVPFAIVLRANGLAVVGSILIPMRLGDLAKPLYFEKVSNFPKTQGFAVIVKEKLWDLIGLAGFCVVVPLFLKNDREFIQLTSIVPLIMVLGIAAYMAMLILPRVVKMISLFKRFEIHTDDFHSETFLGNLTQLIVALSVWWSSCLTFYVFYNVSGLPELSLFQIILVFLASTLGLIATVTPSGLGTYEAAIVTVLTQFDVAWDEGLAFAIGTRFCWMAIPFALGFWAILADGPTLLKRAKS